MKQFLPCAVLVALTMTATFVAGALTNRGLYLGSNVFPVLNEQFNKKGGFSRGIQSTNRGFQVPKGKNKFIATVLGAGYAGNVSTYIAGQELRIMVATQYLSNVTRIKNNFDASIHARYPFAGPHLDAHAQGSISRFLSFGNYSLFPAFNVSGPGPVRVRVIGAGTSRSTKPQTPVPCTSTSHDVWAEFWAMAPRNLAWGRHMAYSSFFTITAPPFRWRMCVKTIMSINSTAAGRISDAGLNIGYDEFENTRGQYFNFREPLYLWETPSTSNNEDDYAAIKVTAHSYIGEQLFKRMTFNHTSYSVADDIKLVPTGYPCTYEHRGSRIDRSVQMARSRTDQYCGSNFVHVVSGQWLQRSTCPFEGSVKHGVAHVGSTRVNPLATSVTPSGFWISDFTTDLDNLVGYLQLPAAGSYDVCVSTRRYRRAVYNMSNTKTYELVANKAVIYNYPVNTMPVWFKAFDKSSSTCTGANEYRYKTTCRPRKTAFTITAKMADVYWSTTDETPGSWGHIKFTTESSTSLSYSALTAWDHSTNREFYTTVGGDQFRLVHDSHFGSNAVTIAGDGSGTISVVTAERRGTETTSAKSKISSVFTTGTLTTSGEGAFTQYTLVDPRIGTMPTVNTMSGCWWMGEDNYGINSLNGNPGSQCCSSAPCTTTNFCRMTETGINGPTASADLGGNPRFGYSAWALDGTGTNAWADVRFPSYGSWYVCYRRAGGNWRVLNGTTSKRTSIYNKTLEPIDLNAGFTYHFNDSHAGTWTPLTIKANAKTGAVLDTQKWNYYTANTATAVGSAVKIVKITESCLHATAQTNTYNINPGALEGTSLGSGLGSGTESATLQTSVVFYVKMVAYSTTQTYRICFKNQAYNWYALSDPNYSPHTYMTSSTAFAAMPTVGITYTLTDTTEGTWSKLLLNRSTDATPAFHIGSINGDIVRIVKNRTSTGAEVFCDMTNGAASTDLVATAQAYSAATTASNLGLQCGLLSGVSTSDCYTGTLQPTDNSINANYPYTDINTDGESNGVSKFDGAVAWIKLPSKLVSTVLQGYKVCYRGTKTKAWIEAFGSTHGSVLTLSTANSISFTAATTTMYAGSYTYVALAASGTTKISWSTALVKLVAWTKNCDGPAVANGGYQKYLTMSGLPSGASSWSTTHCIVDATNSSQINASCGNSGTTTTARAYLTLPTLTGSTAQTTSYRVCYMARSSTSTTTANWQDLSGTGSPLSVYYTGITFTVNNAPYANGALRVTFKSGGVALDTRPERDMVKFITSTKTCVDTSSTDQPYTVVSSAGHQGVEPNASSTGISNLGPTDTYPTRRALVSIILASGSYKTCYKAHGLPWIEVTEAVGSERIVFLNTQNSIITPSTSEVSSATISTLVRAQSTQMTTYGGSTYSNFVVGGSSTYQGGSYYFFITLTSSETVAYSDTVKFVMSHTESATSNGTYTYIAGQDCFSEGITTSVTTTVSSSFALPKTNFPQTPGKYLVCYWRAKTGTWYLPSIATVGNPFALVDNLLGFEVVSTTGIMIKDFHQWAGVSLGALSGTDLVYLVNNSEPCGGANSLYNIASDTASQQINSTDFGIDSTTTLLLGKRSTSVTLSLPITGTVGKYTVCYKATQGAGTNLSTSVPPFRRSTAWIAVRNVGSTYGGGSNYFVSSQATRLNISGCPLTNTSFRLRSGEPFAIKVEAQNDNYERVPYANNAIAYSVTATATTSFTLNNNDGECRPTDAPNYGYTSNALTQFLRDGAATFWITSLSACPSGGCAFRFVASASTVASSPTCTFYVKDQNVWSVLISSQSATSVVLDETFTLRVVGLGSDGQLAHSSSDSVTITTSGANSLTVTTSGGSSFTNGVLDLTMSFTASSYSTTTSETVTITATANGKTSPSVSVTVYRPTPSAVHVVDIYPVTSGSIVPHAMTPGWEPSLTSPNVFRGGDATIVSSAALTAGAGFHLVAAIVYAAKLRVVGTPTGGSARYLTNTKDFNTNWKITIDTTTITAAGNNIYDGSCSTEYCTTTFQQTNFDSAIKTVQFMINNAKVASTSGIVIPFKFDGANVGATATTITSPVRSIASQLQWSCATTLAGLSTAVVGVACPSSQVNKGFYLNVTAVDAFGSRDLYFDGDIYVVLTKESAAAVAPRGIFVSTVAKLAAGSTVVGASGTASAGTAIIPFTLSRACPAGDCQVQVLSNWGADIATVGSVTTTSGATRLKCELATQLAYCTVSTAGVCTGVAGVSATNTTHTASLIYSDTTICANVWAADANGDSTLEATNWVAFFVKTVSGGSLTVTDSAGQSDFVKRYKAMQSSSAKFCWTVGGSIGTRTQFTTTFVAQKFNDASHWTQGTTGRCSLGTLSVWGQKRAAAIKVTSATTAQLVTSGTAGVLAGSISASTYSFDVGLTAYDHYGNALGTNVMSDETTKYIGIGRAGGAVDVIAVGSKALRGYFNATVLTGTTANVTGTINYKLQVDGACLGCRIAFTLVNNDGTWADTITLASQTVATQVNATATIYIDNAKTTAKRVVAFHPSTSPFASYWVNGSTTTNLALTSAPSGNPPVMHVSSCSGSTCQPYEALFNYAKCDGRYGTGTILGSTSSSSPVQIRVMTLDSTTALDGNSEPYGILSHVDILNTYTMSVSFGNQLLSCKTYTCGDDNTAAPKQTIASYGADIKTAVTSFHGVADSSIKVANFLTVGLSTSSYLFVNSSTSKIGSTSLPSVRGAFSAAATHVPATGTTTTLTVTGISGPSGMEFFWRSAPEPRQFVILSQAEDSDPCNETTTYSCYSSTATNCATDGLAQKGYLSTDIKFSYAAQTIPTGVAFPMTVEVRDASGYRVNGASGSVKIAVSSFTGCNNGGEVSFTGTLANGRSTVWLTFAKPCQNCILKATLTPDSSQSTMYSTMNNNPGSLQVFSSIVTITGTQPTPTQLVVTASTPTTAITSTATSLTVADTVTVTVQTRALTGALPIDIAKSTTVGFYNKIPTTAQNWWWYGYGGALRRVASDGALVHHQTVTSSSGAQTHTFLFSRTCAACTVLVGYKISGGSFQSFTLPSTFKITTASTQSTLFGFAPRMVGKGKDTAFALIYTGSEDTTNIPVAGVATNTVAKTNRATVTLGVTTSTNDNGGTLTTTSWGDIYSEWHRVSPSKTCTLCTISAASNTFPIKFTTMATRLFIDVSQANAIKTVSLGGSVDFAAKTLDDAGWVDETFGATGCVFPWVRERCPTVAATAALSSTAGSTPPVNTNSMLMVEGGQQVLNAPKTITAGVGSVNVTYQRPVRDYMPVFEVTHPIQLFTVSSRTTSTYMPIQPVHSVSVGKTGLLVEAALVATGGLTVDKLTATVAFSVDVAMVGLVSGVTGKQYVAIEADNTITVTATNCPSFTSTTNTSAKLMRGYTQMMFTFAASDTTGTCALTFTAGSGATTCSTCSKTLTGLKIAALVASSFNVVRPTTFDNSGLGAGLMFGSAGRSTTVTVELRGATAISGVTAAISSCPNCRLTVSKDASSSTNCAFTTSTSAASFDTNGRASVALTFTDANVDTYTCSVTIAVYSDTSLAASALVSSSTSTVTVCRPAKLRMMTNTTALWGGKFLATGMPYPFYVIVTDSTGMQCRGDSQDDATRLTLDLVANNAAQSQITSIEATNINTTDATTTGFANGNMAATAARKVVQAVGGAFMFNVVFADSTLSKGLNGVRVRVTASSTTPAITSSNAVAVSGPVDTIIAAAVLRFGLKTIIPREIVTSRPIPTAPGTDAITRVDVEAVDGILPTWGFSHGPNLAAASTEFGNNVDAFWQVTPPVAGTFPVTFVGGTQSTNLVGGKASWTSLRWDGADGTFGLNIATSNQHIEDSMPAVFLAQKAVALRVWTKGYTNTAADSCVSNCVLPNSTFPAAASTSSAINGGSPYLIYQSQTAFSVKVVTADVNGMPLLGDNSSVIAVSIDPSTTTGVTLGIPPEYPKSPLLMGRVQQGVVTFNLGILGGTANNSVVKLKFWCPTDRPSELLKPGESTTNPCTLSAVSSMAFTVVDTRASASVFNDPNALAAKKRVKFLTGLTDPRVLNATLFRRRLVQELRLRGLTYFTDLNVLALTTFTFCGVEAAYSTTDSDLSGAVCTLTSGSTTPNCDINFNSLNCPPLVVSCLCQPIASPLHLLGRYLLQSTVNASKTAGELELDLSKADGFVARTLSDVVSGYALAEAATIAALKAIAAEFQIDVSSITTAAANTQPVVPTNVPTPSPPNPVPPPPVPLPPTPTTAPSGSASALTAALALLLAALMALLA